jgi:hypothetical protein
MVKPTEMRRILFTDGNGRLVNTKGYLISHNENLKKYGLKLKFAIYKFAFEQWENDDYVDKKDASIESLAGWVIELFELLGKTKIKRH